MRGCEEGWPISISLCLQSGQRYMRLTMTSSFPTCLRGYKIACQDRGGKLVQQQLPLFNRCSSQRQVFAKHLLSVKWFSVKSRKVQGKLLLFIIPEDRRKKTTSFSRYCIAGSSCDFFLNTLGLEMQRGGNETATGGELSVIYSMNDIFVNIWFSDLIAISC